MPVTLPDELGRALALSPDGRTNWDALPAEVQSGLVAFIKDGWLRRTRRQRAATVTALCTDGAESTLAWMAANAAFIEAARAANDYSGIPMINL